MKEIANLPQGRIIRIDNQVSTLKGVFTGDFSTCNIFFIYSSNEDKVRISVIHADYTFKENQISDEEKWVKEIGSQVNRIVIIKNLSKAIEVNKRILNYRFTDYDKQEVDHETTYGLVFYTDLSWNIITREVMLNTLPFRLIHHPQELELNNFYLLNLYAGTGTNWQLHQRLLYDAKDWCSQLSTHDTNFGLTTSLNIKKIGANFGDTPEQIKIKVNEILRHDKRLSEVSNADVRKVAEPLIGHIYHNDFINIFRLYLLDHIYFLDNYVKKNPDNFEKSIINQLFSFLLKLCENQNPFDTIIKNNVLKIKDQDHELIKYYKKKIEVNLHDCMRQNNHYLQQPFEINITIGHPYRKLVLNYIHDKNCQNLINNLEETKLRQKTIISH